MVVFCFIRSLLIAALAVAGFVAFPLGTARAHPHVFIKHRVEVVFDRSGLTGIRLTWHFDSMYSSMMRADFVSSKTGALSPEDVKNLHDKSFVDLKDQHYFTTVTFNGETLPLGEPTEFSANSVDGDIVYGFFISLKPDPAKVRPENTIEISVFDPSYFVYYELFANDPTRAVGGTELSAACTAKGVWRASVGWGSVHSDLVTCTYHSP
jgi:ABC-type uncharacterized transport system substrate-binding protein